MRHLETAAKIVGASVIPFWMGARGEPVSIFCFYLLVATPPLLACHGDGPRRAQADRQ